MNISSYPEQPILDYEPIEPGKDRGSGKRRGCYGCLVFLALVCALIGGGAYYVYNKVLDVILEDAPLVWPSLDLSTAEIDGARHKLRKVIDIGKGGGSPGVVAFSDRELNALCASFDRCKDRIFFTLFEDEIKVEFSVPYRGCFLNGRLQGTIKAEEGAVRIGLHYGQVGAYVFSQEILQRTAAFLEEECGKSPEVQEFLKTVHTVEITDGRILVKPGTEPEKHDDPPKVSCSAAFPQTPACPVLLDNFTFPHNHLSVFDGHYWLAGKRFALIERPI